MLRGAGRTAPNAEGFLLPGEHTIGKPHPDRTRRRAEARALVALCSPWTPRAGREVEMPNQALYPKVSAVVFALVAVAHAARAALTVPLQVGSTSVPVWASWLGAVGAAALRWWGLRSRA